MHNKLLYYNLFSITRYTINKIYIIVDINKIDWVFYWIILNIVYLYIILCNYWAYNIYICIYIIQNDYSKLFLWAKTSCVQKTDQYYLKEISLIKMNPIILINNINHWNFLLNWFTPKITQSSILYENYSSTSHCFVFLFQHSATCM